MKRTRILTYIITGLTIILLVSGCRQIDTLGDTIQGIIDELSGIGDAISDMIEGITRSIYR